MDLEKAFENLLYSWRHTVSIRDAARRMQWLYQNKFMFLKKKLEYVINFKYDPPIGFIKFCVRNNFGSDAFIFSEVYEKKYYQLPLRFKPTTILDLGANIGLTSVFFFPSLSGCCYSMRRTYF